MAFWAYMLRCSDDSIYVGHTDHLERRLAEHQSGQCPGYTSARLPVQLLWSQEFFSREEALQCELQIKRWSRPKKLALAAGDWAALSRLARGPNRSERARAHRLRSTPLGASGVEER